MASIVKTLHKHKALEYTIIVAANALAPTISAMLLLQVQPSVNFSVIQADMLW